MGDLGVSHFYGLLGKHTAQFVEPLLETAAVRWWFSNLSKRTEHTLERSFNGGLLRFALKGNNSILWLSLTFLLPLVTNI